MIIYSLTVINQILITKRFYASADLDLEYPITLGVYWLKAVAYKVAAGLFLVIAVAGPLLMKLEVPTTLYLAMIWIVICATPTLVAIGCWNAALACQQRKCILTEDHLTYVARPSRQIIVKKSDIEKYWVGTGGNLVIKLKASSKRLVIPLVFEHLSYINKSLLSIYK
ncbi:MAG: hypothetical protein WDO13_18235 [Verrucomicrobiota bacterium]